jgi:hypothetical protein
MHSRVSINSCNVNAQSTIKNDSNRAKNPRGGGMHRCLSLLRNNARFLALHEC